MSNDKKLNPEDIASKLEAKARQLRESGLTQEDLDRAAGGAGFCPCCGSSCTYSTYFCGTDPASGDDHPEGCKSTCIASSPD